MMAATAVLAVGCLSACGPPRMATHRPSPRSTTPVVPTTTPLGVTTTAPTCSSKSFTGSVPPAGLLLVSWTFISPSDGWALGTASASGQACAEIVHTSDGGRSWLVASRPALMTVVVSNNQPCSPSSCVRGLRFANPSDGYAFGPDLLVTTNGGTAWQPESSLPVMDLEASDGSVVRVVSPCGIADQCADIVQAAPAGSSAWRTLDAPQDQWSELVLVGRSTMYLLGRPVFPQAGYSFADLWRSVDGGATWEHLSDPCAHLPTNDPAFLLSGQPGFITHVAAVTSTLAVSCGSQQIGPQAAGYNQGLVVSQDNGSTWGPFHGVPHLSGYDHSSGIYALALASAATAIVVGDEGGVQSSFDDGATWTTTLPQPASGNTVGEVGFENSSVGHVVIPGTTFWTTSNGGRSWASFDFPA